MRTDFTGSALIRLLARLAEVDAPGSRQVFAERLSHWLGWTDAVSLFSALNVSAPAVASGHAGASAEEAECMRVRTTLLGAIAEEDAPSPAIGRGRARLPAPPPVPVVAEASASGDFTPFRRRYFAGQKAMEMGIGPLRERLRSALAARSPAMARLAAVDEVMEQVLAPRERTLLSAVPVMLEKRFVHLRETHAREAQADADDALPAVWHDAFRQEMQAVLLAELDIRFQPVEGLLEALRQPPA
jgi:hypothetical protein